MKQTGKIVLAVGAMALLVFGSGLAWQTVGQYQAVHAEVRTAHMSQMENTAPDGILSAQELLAQPAEQDGVTLHRAVYYPQAQALVCFFEQGDPHRNIYLAALPEAASTTLPEEYGITAEIFEDVPPEALAGGIVVDMTDWQFESSHPVLFAFDG